MTIAASISGYRRILKRASKCQAGLLSPSSPPRSRYRQSLPRFAAQAAAGFGTSAGSAGIRPAGSGSSAAGFPGHGMTGGRVRFHQGRGSGRGALLFPYPYFYPDSDAGYDSQPAAQPQVIVVPASTPAPPPAPPAPRESLLIEWQGDHFVRTTMSAKAASGGQTVPDYSEKSASLPAARRSAPGSKRAVQTAARASAGGSHIS